MFKFYNYFLFICTGNLDFNNYIEDAATGAKAGQNIKLQI